MGLTEDQNTEDFGKQCMQSLRNTLLPYYNDWTCFSCGDQVIKQKNVLNFIVSILFINRIERVEKKLQLLY